ncbi:hypothetical protein C8Q76DRAFT_242828 [Earliella scabrosa]|nr:hypothetical protein C8Q76DRAFT_242828 [Earliella scabrosa]
MVKHRYPRRRARTVVRPLPYSRARSTRRCIGRQDLWRYHAESTLRKWKQYVFNHPSFTSMVSGYTLVSRCECVFSVASRERGRVWRWAILNRARRSLGRGMEPKRHLLHLITTAHQLPPPSTPAEARAAKIPLRPRQGRRRAPTPATPRYAHQETSPPQPHPPPSLSPPISLSGPDGCSCSCSWPWCFSRLGARVHHRRPACSLLPVHSLAQRKKKQREVDELPVLAPASALARALARRWEVRLARWRQWAADRIRVGCRRGRWKTDVLLHRVGSRARCGGGGRCE